MYYLALSYLFEYLCYGFTAIRNVLILSNSQSGDRLYVSQSDVSRHHILTYKDGPRAERVNIVAGAIQH